MKNTLEMQFQNKKMIKLLYITNGITGSGGLERVLSVKTSMLAEEYGYQVHILSLNEIGKELFFSFSDKINFHNLEVSGHAIQYFLKYTSGIQKIVNEVKPDVISVCDDGFKGFFLPHLIKTNAKWIHESHASVLLGNRGEGISFIQKLQHQIKQRIGKRFSRIVLLTDSNRKEWKLDNLIVIPNPLAFETRETSFLRNKKIIAVGSYSYNKGYDLLLSIWERIERNFPYWELNVYGKDTKNNLQAVADQLNLRNISFHDPELSIETKYAESSIFVLPSRSEGFGMVLIEAMSCGVPVVSFDCPNGPRDIITDQEDGFLIENGNIESFAEKLAMLMSDFELRQKMGQVGKNNSNNFRADLIVKKWDELFKKL